MLSSSSEKTENPSGHHFAHRTHIVLHEPAQNPTFHIPCQINSLLQKSPHQFPHSPIKNPNPIKFFPESYLKALTNPNPLMGDPNQTPLAGSMGFPLNFDPRVGWRCFTSSSSSSTAYSSSSSSSSFLRRNSRKSD